MMRFLCALVLASVTSSVMAEDIKNVLYDDLVNKGVPLPNGPTFKLPPPLHPPGQLPKDINALLDKVAGRYPKKLVIHNSVTAPFSHEINAVKNDAGQRVGQLITVRFLAYGKMAAAQDADFLKQLLTGSKKGKKDKESIVLKPEELAKRNIGLMNVPNVKEEFGTLTLELLDKIRVDGMARSVHVGSDECVVYANRLDDRFKADKQYPNQWRRIIPAAGGSTLGPSNPYSGLGGYVIVTKLPDTKLPGIAEEVKGALLVEMEFLLHESPDWFERDLLRSKMPTAIQDNVRSFRRKLANDAPK